MIHLVMYLTEVCSSSTFPFLIKHETIPRRSHSVLLISSFRSSTVASLKPVNKTSCFLSDLTCCTKSAIASGLNSSSILPLDSTLSTGLAFEDGIHSGESLVNVSLPFSQAEPSIIRGLVCCASTLQNPRYLPPNVMSTSAASKN